MMMLDTNYLRVVHFSTASVRWRVLPPEDTLHRGRGHQHPEYRGWPCRMEYQDPHPHGSGWGEQMREAHEHSAVEQLAARMVHTHQVAGSSPARATMTPRARQVCSESGCPNWQPCPTHRRRPWSSSDRAARLPANWPKLRAQVRKRDQDTCQGCGCHVPKDQGSIDHRRRGDDHTLANLQLLCDPCHEAKTLAEAAAARRSGGVGGRV